MIPATDAGGGHPSPPTAGAASGLSAYLEDIVSDEDPMTDDMDTTPPPTSHLPSKDELLQMMEKVDRSSIASVSVSHLCVCSDYCIQYMEIS